MTAPQDPFASPGDTPQQPGPPGPPAQPGPPGLGQPTYGQPTYGQPAYGGAPFGAPQAAPRNGTGLASLVLGILSLVSWFLVIGGLFGLVAIVLGFLARGKVKRREATNGGMALAGIITGLIGVLLTALVIAGTVALFNNGEFSSFTECVRDAGNDQAKLDECARDFEESVR